MTKMKSLLTFTSYLGDTFLSSAVARKIEKETGSTVLIPTLSNEMANIASKYWGATTICGSAYSKLIKEGSLFNKKARLITTRENGKWKYRYEVDPKYREKLEELCLTILADERWDTVYTLHNTFPHALLGYMALKQGINVRGYCLNEGNELLLSIDGKYLDCIFWTEDYIGDRISKFATGKPLQKEDFYCSVPKIDIVVPRTVTLFPGTRSRKFNAENWDLDIEFFTERGYKVKVATYKDEPHFIETTDFIEVNYESVEEMIHLINSSELIVCNDSIAFHLAWYYGKKAIVKEKAGFNKEWQPQWVRYNNYDFYFIPPSEYFPEEYFHILGKAMSQLEILSRNLQK